MSRRWHEESEKKKSSGKKKVGGFRGFVSHTLTRADKKEYVQYELTEDLTEDLLPRVVNEGYRLSLSVDQRNGAYMAALSTKQEDSVNNGLVLTARSGADPLQAGLRVLFMHYVIFDEKWPDPQVAEEYTDEWDVPPE